MAISKPDENADSVSARSDWKSVACEVVLMMNKLNNIQTLSSQAKPPKMESERDSEREHATLLVFDKLCALCIRPHVSSI